MNNQEIVSRFNLSGLHCQACQKIIQKRVMQIKGVKSVDVLLSGETIIIADQIINNDQIEDVLKGTDYEVL